MKTLLVLAGHPGFAEAVRAGLNPEQYRVIDRASLEEAERMKAVEQLYHYVDEAAEVGAKRVGFLSGVDPGDAGELVDNKALRQYRKAKEQDDG
jgi:hypothetical protein